jgi:hypothetical protein
MEYLDFPLELELEIMNKINVYEIKRNDLHLEVSASDNATLFVNNEAVNGNVAKYYRKLRDIIIRQRKLIQEIESLNAEFDRTISYANEKNVKIFCKSCGKDFMVCPNDYRTFPQFKWICSNCMNKNMEKK